MGILKLNFDAFVSANGTFIAYIIRNSMRVLIQVESKMISQTTIPNAKLMLLGLIYCTSFSMEFQNSTAECLCERRHVLRA